MVIYQHLKITEGHPDPCMNNVFLRCSTGNQPVHIRLPITPEILKQVWFSAYVQPDITMMCAPRHYNDVGSMLLRFFAFLCCGEFTSTKESHSAPLQAVGVHVDVAQTHMHQFVFE